MSFAKPRAPRRSWKAPTSITIRNSAEVRRSGGSPASDWLAVSEAAAVVVITISCVLEVRPPTIGPIIVA